MWSKLQTGRIVAINNAWRVRPDWDDAIYPEDFPDSRRPQQMHPGQRRIEAAAFIPAQNAYGGVIFNGATMAFTAGYWALHALRPDVLAFFGCDMVYPAKGPTHYYGTGTADPLRVDITLRDLEAKSARLGTLAALQGCRCLNLSTKESRLLFARAQPEALGQAIEAPLSRTMRLDIAALRASEDALGYDVPSGRYWEELKHFDPGTLDAIDQRWRAIWSALQKDWSCASAA
jgi:hypothetical protein